MQYFLVAKDFNSTSMDTRSWCRQTTKPLENIMKKPLGLASPRLQRMLLQLQRYDLEVHHVPGKNIPVAGVLSGKFMPTETTDQSVGDLDVQMSRFTASSPPCPSQTVTWNKFVLLPLKTLRCMTFKLLYRKFGLNIDKTARNPFWIAGIFVMNSLSSTALSLKARRSLFLNHLDQRCWTRSMQVILGLKKH